MSRLKRIISVNRRMELRGGVIFVVPVRCPQARLPSLPVSTGIPDRKTQDDTKEQAVFSTVAEPGTAARCSRRAATQLRVRVAQLWPLWYVGHCTRPVW